MRGDLVYPGHKRGDICIASAGRWTTYQSIGAHAREKPLSLKLGEERPARVAVAGSGRIAELEHDLYDGNEAHYIETGERLDYYLVPTRAERQRFKDKEPGLVWSPREYSARPN